jgi:hypothetical protein
MLKKISRIFPLLLSALVLAACVAHQAQWLPPLQHPEDAGLGKRPPICTDCHEASDEHFNWQRFNHDTYFGDNHRQQAYQNSRVCGMCHQQSFCSDCHAIDIELKPSDKNPTATYRRSPHRGDWLARHRIEGALDPTSCIRCHRNPKTAATCVPCHG